MGRYAILLLQSVLLVAMTIGQSAFGLSLRNGYQVEQQVFQSKWDAIKLFADRDLHCIHVVLCLVEEFEKAQKNGTVCRITELYGPHDVELHQQRYIEVLKELKILDENGMLDQDTGNILVSAISGVHHTLIKHGAIRVPSFSWRTPVLVNPQATFFFLRKIPFYDRLYRAYTSPHKD